MRKTPWGRFGRGLLGAIPGLFGAGGHGAVMAPFKKQKTGFSPFPLVASKLYLVDRES
jgi:hypothetical protein